MLSHKIKSKDYFEPQNINSANLYFVTKMTEGGRITIPAKCRELLGLSINDEVIIRIENGQAYLYTWEYAAKLAKELLQKHTKNHASLVDELIKERREEAARENDN